MSNSYITGPFLAVALALPSSSLADNSDTPEDTLHNNTPAINMLSCSARDTEEHEQYFSQTQQVLVDSALTIGCLLRDADEGYDNTTNIKTTVQALQKNLTAYAEAHDMELIDGPDENGNYDGILGEWTAEDFIDVAMAMNIDTPFRVDAFDPLSEEHADMMRFAEELKRFHLSSFEVAQLWAMELEFQETPANGQQPNLPFNGAAAIRNLPLCEDTPGWGLNDIPCDQKASFESPVTVSIARITYDI